MAGRGPAPKDPDERARTNAPARGEWTTLAPLVKPILPALPKRGRGAGAWSPRTRATWNAWRKDPVTGVYGPAEIAMALDAIHVFEEMVRDPKPTWSAEVRQWMDRLGLSLKGKRDLRLRMPEGDASTTKTPGRSTSRERYGDLVVLPGGQAVGE